MSQFNQSLISKSEKYKGQSIAHDVKTPKFANH